MNSTYWANPEKWRAKARAMHQHLKNRPEYIAKRRDRTLRYKYGISAMQKEEMFKNQKGLCGICMKVLPDVWTTHVDHNHKTGAVRGLLCHRCNAGLAFIEDNFFMQSAKRYLA